MQRLLSWVQLATLGSGLGASALLLAEYSSDAPSLCAVNGGCDAVRNSAFANLAGIPTPVLGLLFFSLLIALRVLSAPLRFQRALATAGALGAIGLLAIQAWIVGAFCQYCVVVDVSAVAYGALLWREQTKPHKLHIAVPLVTAGALYVAVVSSASTPRVDVANSALAMPATDQLTITEFVDFECPACRALHIELASALEQIEGEVDVVRRHVPLERHRHARIAARAYCCADAAGKAEQMADVLFKADALSKSDCEDIAVSVGVPMDAYRKCIESDTPEETIARDEELASEIGLRALPTFFVGTQRFEGVRGREDLVAAIESALAERRN